MKKKRRLKINRICVCQQACVRVLRIVIVGGRKVERERKIKNFIIIQCCSSRSLGDRSHCLAIQNEKVLIEKSFLCIVYGSMGYFIRTKLNSSCMNSMHTLKSQQQSLMINKMCKLHIRTHSHKHHIHL